VSLISNIFSAVVGGTIVAAIQYFGFDPWKQRKERATNARLTAIEHYTRFRIISKKASETILKHANTVRPSDNIDTQNTIEKDIQEAKLLASSREFTADGPLNSICAGILSELENGLHICGVYDPVRLRLPGERTSPNTVPASRQEALSPHKNQISNLFDELDTALLALIRED